MSTRVPPRVLVTRSARQGSELAKLLRGFGADPVLVPAIDLVEPTSFTILDLALRSLSDYNWLLFTSANAVEVFDQRRALPGVPLPHGLKVAAIGPATKEALLQRGIPADLTPPLAVAEALLAALLPQVKAPDGHPTKFLLIRAEQARELLPEALANAGAEVTVAPAYRTVIPPDSIGLLQRLLAEPTQSLQAVTFTSSSTVRNLLALCEAAGVALPVSALRISIGPITSEALRTAGVPPHAEAKEATTLALAEAVMEALRRASFGPA